MNAIANTIARGAILVAGIALFAILAVIGAQIAARVFTGNSLSWSDELARLFFLYLVFIGAAETSVRHTHIAVDLKDTFRLPGEIDRLLDLGRMVLCIAVLAIIAVGAWKIIPVVENMQRPATRLSTAWMYYPVLVGSLLMIVATAINFIACIARTSPYPPFADDNKDKSDSN
ncbi:TRAP transporter small permease [Tropicimonas aquimaris]|uniref:TRAP transporter small permease protein n=1 Tax=Tropicimonas aquimaris TaxID=914152 RepID=A0ABW3IS45_9RHOB